MANPSYTYTLTNGTTADADQVMQNFNDILAGITDGTKDISVAALTAAGTATLNGHVNLGNSASDDLTVTASLASTIPIKTTNTYNIGSATQGLAGVYFGTGDTDTARVVAGTLAASRTYTLPDAGAAANFVMSEGAQTKNGLLTLNDGVTVGSVSGNSALTFYGAGSDSVTFSFNGSGGNSSGTVKYTRIGNVLIVKVPAIQATTGTTSTAFSSTSFLPAWATPATSQYAGSYRVRNNGAAIATPGIGRVSGSTIVVYRDGSQTAWTNSASGGLEDATTFTFVID